MVTLAELTKRQRDQAFHQQMQDPNKGVIISSESAEGRSGSLANPAFPVWNSIQNKPETFPPAAHSMVSHADAPASYAGQAGKALVVNPTADGLVFGDTGGGASAAFDYGLITSAAGSELDQDWGVLI